MSNDLMDTSIDFNDLESREKEYDLAQSAAHPETARILSELDRRTSARRIAVPTKDSAVRHELRAVGEPVCLFGERPEDRRDRLRQVWSKLRELKGEAGGVESESGSEDSSDDDGDKEEEFYTEGTTALQVARRGIADYSLDRCVFFPRLIHFQSLLLRL